MLSDLGAMRVASEMHRQRTWAGCQSQKVSMATTSFRSPVRTRTLRLQRALLGLTGFTRQLQSRPARCAQDCVEVHCPWPWVRLAGGRL